MALLLIDIVSRRPIKQVAIGQLSSQFLGVKFCVNWRCYGPILSHVGQLSNQFLGERFCVNWRCYGPILSHVGQLSRLRNPKKLRNTKKKQKKRKQQSQLPISISNFRAEIRINWRLSICATAVSLMKSNCPELAANWQKNNFNNWFQINENDANN